MGTADIPGAPVFAMAAFVVACFWPLSEIELAHLCHRHVRLDRDKQVATLQLSVSKTDPRAIGCSRSWGCVFAGPSSVPCGYHAVLQVLGANCSLCGDGGVLPDEWPLFPAAGGGIMRKDGVVLALERHVVAFAA